MTDISHIWQELGSVDSCVVALHGTINPQPKTLRVNPLISTDLCTFPLTIMIPPCVVVNQTQHGIRRLS